jgi:hypothetical protein
MARFHNVDGVRIQFTAEEEAAQDAKVAAYEADRPRRLALQEIARLESLETPRRLAEAVLTVEGKTWLEANRALIAVERAKL